ncbi:hypothetical protein P4119_18160 [Pseudomonas aeruginosa]|nr:hypothetical protein [Pseudomonas aeruginosa]
MRLLRWDDFLRQPVVKGRVATLPTSGQVEGDIYIFTGAGANQNRLARWWATGATTAIWEYMPPRLGWRVQVANETTPSGQVKTYEYSGTAWVELVGGMSDAPSDGKPYARESGAWAELGSAAKSALNVLPFMNLMPDMGRFAGTAANPLNTMFTTSWTPSTFINGWNGASLADGGKFAFDNSTNGGAGPALNARVQALLAAMGRTRTSVSRYGVEFFTTVLTAGTQTTTGSAGADGVTRYLCCSNGSKTRFQRGRMGDCRHVAASRKRLSSYLVGAYTTHKLWINGAVAAPGVVLPANQWVHLRFSMQSYNGYDNACPYIYASAGSGRGRPAAPGGRV